MDLLKGGLINDESGFEMTRKESSIMPRGCEEDVEEELEDDEEDTLGIQDVYWADNIRNIEDPILREKEIEAAKELKEEQRILPEDLESGEIDHCFPTGSFKYIFVFLSLGQ